MSRRWLGLGLLLSLGVNIGILATLGAERLREGGRGAGTPAASAPAVGKAAEQPAPPPPPPPEGPAAEEPPPPAGAEGPAAGTGSQAMPPGMERRLGELADRMGLEGDRRAKFLELQGQFFRKIRGVHDEGIDLQRSLRQELTSSEPSRERLKEVLDKLDATRRQLDQSMVELVLATREILDPQQEREYLRFVGRLRAVGEGRGGPGPGPPREGPPPRGLRRDGPPRDRPLRDRQPPRGPLRRPPR